MYKRGSRFFKKLYSSNDIFSNEARSGDIRRESRRIVVGGGVLRLDLVAFEGFTVFQ